MVKDGLKGCMGESQWEPSTNDLDVFTSACRGLPVMASIRIREVQFQTQSGSDLESEFEYFLNLQAAPQDLNQEYLRIMRRAFRPRLSRIRPHIEKNYREVVGMIIAAQEPLSVHSMSHLLGIAEGKIHAILNPISSIIDVPPNNAKVKFYHATATEFITGVPIGDDEDKGFFIDDPKGYFLGLRFLRFVNNTIHRNEIGLPTELPLGDKKKWDNFSMKGQPDYVVYSFEWLFSHLNPALLFSEESNELQGEFEQLLLQNLFSFLAASRAWLRKHKWVWEEWCYLDEFTNHELIKLLDEAFRSILAVEFDPWNLYRCFLPFTPSSSHLHRLYGKLSDPVRIFSVSGEFSGGFIPLSEDACKAREAMEAKLTELPKKFHKYLREETNYEAEFAEPDVRNGVVTCAAISHDGSHVALGFGSGVIEVADIDHQHTISRFQCNPPKPPVWIEFIGGGNVRIATEDTDGNISILSHGTHLVPLGALPTSRHPAITALSSNGCCIMRVPRNQDENWYGNVALLYFSGEPSTRLLASPSAPSDPQSPQPYYHSSTPPRHTAGFSPGGRYVGAFDMNCAFIWSTGTCEVIAQYCVQDFRCWISMLAIATHVQSSEPDPTHNADESWLKSPFYDLSPNMGKDPRSKEDIMLFSSVIGEAPLIIANGLGTLGAKVSFDGKVELVVHPRYNPIFEQSYPSSENEPWYGDHVFWNWETSLPFYLPRASKDGRRFLLQGKLRAPVVIDISKVV
ncbi:uncharacterized protein EI90DRAFT_3039244, partial [Cantharellus anzutake]|uniref:uncharacterized protein n=1 Tax=Cantharellus anzutake TaxID=1750568 RepID=UPI00190438B0